MKEFRLDKSAFKKQSVKEADHNLEYWQSKSTAERLHASWYLTCSAYGYPSGSKIRMDKSFFSIRKRID